MARGEMNVEKTWSIGFTLMLLMFTIGEYAITTPRIFVALCAGASRVMFVCALVATLESFRKDGRI